MRKNQFLIFSIILILAVNVYAEQKMPSGIWLDSSSMAEMKLPATGDITYLLLDFEYPKNKLIKALTRDFNGDGVSDYFVEAYESLCGTGGCPYAMVDGKSSKRIGDFSGSPILVLDQKINGFPVIQSYGHMNVDSGSFVAYVFDGKKYQVVSSVFVSGQSVTDLFKSLNSYRKIKSQDKNGH